jgi:two-component system chemotaxis sensor kinase CheA
MSDNDIVSEFLVESYENLDLLDRELVALEKEPANREKLASVFRTIHTIKGTCGFLGFSKLEAVAHVGENLLSKLRDGLIELTPERATALLQMVDAIRQMLASIEKQGNEGERDDRALIQVLERLQLTGEKAAAAAKEEAAAQPAAPAPAPVAAAVKVEEEATPAAVAEGLAGIVRAEEGGEGSVGAEQHGEMGAGKTDSAAGQTGSRGPSASEGSIRVDVGLLDRLMNLVGELVLARNQVLQYTNSGGNAGLLGTSQRLNLLTTELQEGVMKTRMQPIGNIWSKFPRTVRDVAISCGKQVRIQMEGKETELDKTIIEAIKDPLTHLVRNSVDHGIERPEERVAANKPVEGLLLLRAFHEGGQVIIEISDDGAGLNLERIRRKAVERGLLSPEQAARMNDREAAGIIFLPGFSTAEKVTNVSGRGVGMDVVKTNIEKIGGTVDIQSKPGHGSTVRMKIPLTLAIIPALVVSSGGDRYAIPQVSLLELVRIEAENAAKAIEIVHGAPVYRLRGRLLPLVYLNRELQVEGQKKDEAGADATNIVVLQADDRHFGLVVDEINDTEEIVVKPLGKQLKGVTTFAGATIMGDGEVALILDVLGVAQRAGVVGEVRDRAMAEKDKTAEKDERKGDKQILLLFRNGRDGRMAIELSLVARLEEFEKKKVEKAGDREVIQYRGQIMQLLRVSELLGIERESVDEEQETMHVVVYAENGVSVGLVVDRILDIVEDHVVMQKAGKRHGILGSAVIQQRVTDLLDVRGLIREANVELLEIVAA